MRHAGGRDTVCKEPCSSSIATCALAAHFSLLRWLNDRRLVQAAMRHGPCPALPPGALHTRAAAPALRARRCVCVPACLPGTACISTNPAHQLAHQLARMQLGPTPRPAAPRTPSATAHMRPPLFRLSLSEARQPRPPRCCAARARSAAAQTPRPSAARSRRTPPAPRRRQPRAHGKGSWGRVCYVHYVRVSQGEGFLMEASCTCICACMCSFDGGLPHGCERATGQGPTCRGGCERCAQASSASRS